MTAPGATATGTRRVLVTAAVCVAYLLVMMDYSVINVALQTIQETFGASNLQLQWIVNAYEIFFAALMLPAGFLADRYGRRRILLGGLALFALASIGITTSGSPGEIIFWRALMGAGGSAIPATTLAVIKNLFGESERARPMALWAAMSGASVAFGPVLGGALVQGFAWWSVFLLNVPLVALCAAVLWRAAPETTAPTVAPIDRLGVLLTITGVGAVTFGLTRGGEAGDWLTPGTLGLIVLGAVLIAVLVSIESRCKTPILDVRLLRDRTFASGTVVVALVFFALAGSIFLLVFYLQLVRGATPIELGVAMLPLAAGSIAGSLVCATVLTRLGVRTTAAAGMAALAAGFTGFALIGAHSPVALVELCFLAAGLGLGLTTAAATPLTMATVPADQAASGAGTANMIRCVASIISVALLGSVYSLVYRDALGSGFPVNAGHSLSQTLTAVGGRSDAVTLVERAVSAFMEAFHAGMWIAVTISSAGVLASLLWLPRSAESVLAGKESR